MFSWWWNTVTAAILPTISMVSMSVSKFVTLYFENWTFYRYIYKILNLLNQKIWIFSFYENSKVVFVLIYKSWFSTISFDTESDPNPSPTIFFGYFKCTRRPSLVNGMSFNFYWRQVSRRATFLRPVVLQWGFSV